eukprot:maker-scaffold_4-snap-gene-20.49-mRNA-1 protein AED:0.16 eAED:0.16 QI:0/1/0.5/1/0/0/2/969/279
MEDMKMEITPSNDLYQRIVYSSRLATESTEDAETAMRYIFKASEANNKARGICSMIYFDLHSFLIVQLLEGPKEKVEELFIKISQDQRHSRVTRVVFQQIRESEKWYKKVGLTRGAIDDINMLKEKMKELGEENVAESKLTGAQILDLPTMDVLPIAGDFDLSYLRLTYHSKFRAGTNRDLIFDMQEIVEKAQKKNERMLDVFQCLEGPNNKVMQLYEEIKRDTRHENVVTLLLEKPSVRRYRTWGMVWASKEAKDVLLSSVPKNILSQLNLGSTMLRG